MKKVITYGTYDLLHYGHIRLLERAKQLGDYLIVGVTANDFDKRRGKINVQQTLMERIENVKKTGLADEIIIEEYEGQKIDDIINYGIDVFTVGSDWVGKFDYLKEYCEVVYLDRTEGISSTELRTENSLVKLGVVGNYDIIRKYINESKYVNGLNITSICSSNNNLINDLNNDDIKAYDNYDLMLDEVDAVFVVTSVDEHYNYAMKALKKGKHVLCETPISTKKDEYVKLLEYSKKKNLVFMENIKTAYSTAFMRLLLLVKSGVIGNVISIDATCTSLNEYKSMSKEEFITKQNSICAWGSTCMLPVFSILGVNYNKKHFSTYYLDKELNFDLFTKIDLIYDNAVATIKVGKGVKSEGELIISGTNGYIFVPAPWWKTDYFEVRFENPLENKRYFYKLEGEGIRYEYVSFLKLINGKNHFSNIDSSISMAISSLIEDYNKKQNLDEIVINNGGKNEQK